MDNVSDCSEIGANKKLEYAPSSVLGFRYSGTDVRTDGDKCTIALCELLQPPGDDCVR